MKKLLNIIIICMGLPLFAQVGINTTSPDPSAALDIQGVNKGVLIPKISLDNIATTQIDGTNTAATGLMIYNTNASTTGGTGMGFYVFNGSSWDRVTTSADGIGGSDADFFEEGTTNAPDAITDDVYTQGNMAIGKNTADYPMDIFGSGGRSINIVMPGSDSSSKEAIRSDILNTGNGNHYGMYNTFGSGGTGIKRGVFNIFQSSTGSVDGVFNQILTNGSSLKAGIRNQITGGGNSIRFGVSNSMVNNGGNSQYGVDNNMSGSGTGFTYGTRNILTGNASTKFGIFNSITPSSAGTHYGTYNEVLKSGSFAGFFAGNVAIGTEAWNAATPNYYVLPVSRGTNGQVMQTDGSGNVNWVDVSSIAEGNADFYEVGTTSPPGDITDNVYRNGNVFIGTGTGLPGKLAVSQNETNQTAVTINHNSNFSGASFPTYSSLRINSSINNSSASGNLTTYGIYLENSPTSASTGVLSAYGNFLRFSGSQNNNIADQRQFLGTSSTQDVGTRNDFQNTNSTAGMAHLGTYNYFYTGTSGNRGGLLNAFGASGGYGFFGNEWYGVNNNFQNTNTGISMIGLKNRFIGSAQTSYGVYNDWSNASTTVAYNKYGVYTTIPSTVAGTHYGIYNDVQSSSGYAAYFLGRTAIGTTTTNTYILPSSRGTNGQIMQTDGSGNVNWVDASAIGGSDVDFYEIGTTNSPNDISDNIYTMGKLQIGRDTEATARLLVDTDNTSNEESGIANLFNPVASTSFSYGIFNDMGSDHSSVSGNTFSWGLYNINDTNSYYKYGINNTVTANGGGLGARTGIVNTVSQFDAATGNGYGINTILNVGSGTATRSGIKQRVLDNHGGSTGILYGFESDILNSGSGPSIGFSSLLQTNNNNIAVAFDAAFAGNSGLGNKYGLRATISPSVGGTNHYGVYSEALRSGTNTFAAYFLGNVSVGTTTSNNYIFPASRGTNGQIMQTDGSGNVSWVDNTTTSFWSRTGTTLDVATTADDISFSSDQTSIIFPATSGSPSTMIHLFASGTTNSDRMVFSQSPGFSNWGLMYRDSNDSFRFLSSGNDRVVINLGGGGNPLVVNGTAQATAFQSATTTYPDYVFESYFEGASTINPNYQFQSLGNIEQFIKDNGHLPGVTSYDEVKAKDMQINLTETSVKNLEKIEELFLYTIQLKKENDQLKANQKALENRLSKLEKLINK